jgi:DNA-binding PadR family transcriptional regulator
MYDNGSNFDDNRFERQWHRFEQQARRALRGIPGMGRLDWEGFSDNIRIGRMLAGGDLRLVALYLIEQQPRHGYDLIKAIEEKTSGFYAPSPGVVYPALTYLEEAGYVTATADGNKRSYAITDEGRAHLADNREAVEATLAYLGRVGRRMGEIRQKFTDFDDKLRGAPEADRPMHGVAPELDKARQAVKAALRHAAGLEAEAQRQAAAALEKAAAEIRAMGRPHDDDGIDV